MKKAIAEGNQFIAKVILITNFIIFIYLLYLSHFLITSIISNKILIIGLVNLLLSLIIVIFIDLFQLPNSGNNYSYPIENYICVINCYLLSHPFQIIYFIAVQQSSLELIPLFLAIEIIFRYSAIIHFYYSGILNLISSLLIIIHHFTVLNLNSDIRKELSNFMFLYTTILISSVIFSFVYEKYLFYETNYHCAETSETFLLEIINNMRCSFTISSKDKILYKNKLFDELMENEFNTIIEENHFELEEGNLNYKCRL